MMLEINGNNVETDAQGFLCHLDEWTEAYTRKQAMQDNLVLFDDHWELIYYFRAYHEENLVSPTMHTLVRDFGGRGKHFHDQKSYEKHIYSLFPFDPVHEVCKLAGLPLPPPDT